MLLIQASEANSEPSQTNKMEIFVKIVKQFKAYVKVHMMGRGGGLIRGH